MVGDSATNTEGVHATVVGRETSNVYGNAHLWVRSSVTRYPRCSISHGAPQMEVILASDGLDGIARLLHSICDQLDWLKVSVGVNVDEKRVCVCVCA